MTPKEFVEQELKLITKIFDIQKRIAPEVVFVKDDKRVQMPAYFNNAVQKETVSMGIKELVRNNEPDIVIWFAEAWITKIKSFNELRDPHPDNREEIVSVQIEFKTGEKYSCEAKINRRGKTPRLGKFRYTEKDLSMGRFCDFYPQKRMN